MSAVTEVYLVSYTPDLERVCAAAMRSCHSQKPSHATYSDRSFDEEKVGYMIRKAIELGHLGVIEHGSLTFSISGVSRSFTHQLVRHRLASYSQQSQRHVRMRGERWYLRPPKLKDEKFDQFMALVKGYYDSVLEVVTEEDARFVLPNAALTHITMTANPREFRHVFSFRCDPSAQWEIRDVCWAMLGLSMLIAPNIFSSLDPPAARSEEAMRRFELLRSGVDAQREEFRRLERGRVFKLKVGVDLEHPVDAYALKVA